MTRRQWIPDPCGICDQDLATWSELGRKAHWSNHNPFRRLWHHVKEWFK